MATNRTHTGTCPEYFTVYFLLYAFLQARLFLAQVGARPDWSSEYTVVWLKGKVYNELGL